MVPAAWAALPVPLATDNLAAWLADLQYRLDFLYDWAVDGPPPVMPLGLLARPRSFLTAVQQSFAEVLGRPVGQVRGLGGGCAGAGKGGRREGGTAGPAPRSHGALCAAWRRSRVQTSTALGA